MTAKARIRAIDRFIKGCREDGIYDDLNACCVMAGWDSLAGALTPLKGAAPTNSGFLDADLDRGIGLKGNGSSKYLNSNRANNADPQNDQHLSVYATVPTLPGLALAGALGAGGTSGSQLVYSALELVVRVNQASSTATGVAPLKGLHGASRFLPSAVQWRSGGLSGSEAVASYASGALDIFIFARNYANPAVTDAALSFYSIGSATDLALLDARVSTLMEDLRAIEEVGFDRDALAYIRAVEEADGAYLETDVKIAINNLVSGLKSEGLWDAIGASCLLCGPRTLAGALVPLRGDAPTPNGFVSGDYSRTDGLRDPEGTSHLDSGYAISDPTDNHYAVFLSVKPSATSQFIASDDLSLQRYLLYANYDADETRAISGRVGGANLAYLGGAGSLEPGFKGASRSGASSFEARANETTTAVTCENGEATELSVFVFARNESGSPQNQTDAGLSFFSIGSSLDLAKLDTHVSAYVTAIGAAI